jgi:hypothetical protein
MCKVLKFTHVYVLSGDNALSWRSVHMNGKKCSINAGYDMQSTWDAPEHQPAMRHWTKPQPWFSSIEESLSQKLHKN